MTTSSPLISVIIPTWNRPKLLRECLTALTHQTFRDFEVCVVNDGGVSIENVVSQFPSLILHAYDLKEDRGPAAARNQGIKMASGKWIALCDDDDLFLPTHLESLVKATHENDFIYSDGELVYLRTEKKERLSFAFAYDKQLLRKTNFILVSGILYKKELHDQLGYFDEKMRRYEDWDWYLRVSERHQIARVPFATVLCGLDAAGSNTSSHPEKFKAQLDSFCKKHHLGDLPVSNFEKMVSDPSLEPWRRPTKRLWDGTLFWR